MDTPLSLCSGNSKLTIKVPKSSNGNSKISRRLVTLSGTAHISGTEHRLSFFLLVGFKENLLTDQRFLSDLLLGVTYPLTFLALMFFVFLSSKFASAVSLPMNSCLSIMHIASHSYKTPFLDVGFTLVFFYSSDYKALEHFSSFCIANIL